MNCALQSNKTINADPGKLNNVNFTTAGDENSIYRLDDMSEVVSPRGERLELDILRPRCSVFVLLPVLPSQSPWNFPCNLDESRNHLLFLSPYSY